jgi:hypothetical protein
LVQRQPKCFFKKYEDEIKKFILKEKRREIKKMAKLKNERKGGQ